jgi:hypothetical protein
VSGRCCQRVQQSIHETERRKKKKKEYVRKQKQRKKKPGRRLKYNKGEAQHDVPAFTRETTRNSEKQKRGKGREGGRGGQKKKKKKASKQRKQKKKEREEKNTLSKTLLSNKKKKNLRVGKGTKQHTRNERKKEEVIIATKRKARSEISRRAHVKRRKEPASPQRSSLSLLRAFFFVLLTLSLPLIRLLSFSSVTLSHRHTHSLSSARVGHGRRLEFSRDVARVVGREISSSFLDFPFPSSFALPSLFRYI